MQYITPIICNLQHDLLRAQSGYLNIANPRLREVHHQHCNVVTRNELSVIGVARQMLLAAANVLLPFSYEDTSG
jgi:hypothetical protein